MVVRCWLLGLEILDARISLARAPSTLSVAREDTAYYLGGCVSTGLFVARGVVVASAAAADLVVDVILCHDGRIASLGRGKASSTAHRVSKRGLSGGYPFFFLPKVR